MLEINKIYNMDCLEGLKSIPDKTIDLTCTDIPYGVVNRKSNGLRNLDKGSADILTFELSILLAEICRVTNGSIYIFCGTEQVSEIRHFLVKEGLSTRLIIWEKTNPSPVNGQYIWLSGVECCVYGKFKNATYNGHCENTVLRFPSGRNKLHPTQKPLNLIEKLITQSSNPDDTVLDPFMGSGTTAVACINTNRNYIGFEINPDYYKTAEERIRKVKLDKLLEVKENA
jgi:DNA modification methylase